MFTADAPRRRPAPEHFTLVDETGVVQEHHYAGPTLVVAVKDDCMGCANFYRERHPGFAPYEVIVVATNDAPISGSAYPIFRSPELLAALDIRSAPFFVLITGEPPEVTREGLVYDVSQVLEELR